MARITEIILFHGNVAAMPLLREGEPAFAVDTGQLYVGNGVSNVPIGGARIPPGDFGDINVNTTGDIWSIITTRPYSFSDLGDTTITNGKILRFTNGHGNPAFLLPVSEGNNQGLQIKTNGYGRLYIASGDSSTTAVILPSQSGMAIQQYNGNVQAGPAGFATTSFTQADDGVWQFGRSLGGDGNGYFTCGGVRRLNADATNATTAMASIAGLTIGVIAGRKYVGRFVVYCENTVATEGIKLDFDGGTATMTSLRATAFVAAGGLTVNGTQIVTTLAGDMNFSTITGLTVVIIEISFVVNAGGTLVLRFAEDSSAAGTLTVFANSNAQLFDSVS